jgi:hypothetical protein
MYDDKFNMDYLSIPVEKLDTGNRPKKVKPEAFIKMPRAWITRLQEAKRASSHRLAYFLQYHNWKRPGEPIVVSNVKVADWGLDRHEKRKAILELESLGLIETEQTGKQSPIVKLLVPRSAYRGT